MLKILRSGPQCIKRRLKASDDLVYALLLLAGKDEKQVAVIAEELGRAECVAK